MIFTEDRKHYRVTEGPCHDVLMAWREAREAVDAQHFEFTKSVGASGHFPGHDDSVGNALAINGFIFEGSLPAGWKERRWKSQQGLKRGQVVGWPDQRTTVGKETLKAIKALPLRQSTYGPCDAIGFPSSLTYKGENSKGSCHLGMWETLKVGWIEDVFYVSLPDEVKRRRKLEAEGYTVEGEPWTPLPGMVEILKEEEALDYARHRQKREAA